jgi:hypothetical protein
MPSIIDNPELYEKAKRIVYQEYPKHSAYRSGQLVKRYKEMGGTYSGKKDSSGLTSWFKENWKDIGGLEYPVYRPTKRVNKNTPLTPDEIDPENLLQQILLKQQYKGDKNLPAFQGKGVPLAFGEYKIDPYAYKQAKKLGIKIEPSKKKFKKIDIYDYNNQYIMSIGDTRYNDYRSYIKERGQEYADTRRRLYKIRHERNRHKLGTPAYYADQLLW